MIRKIIEHLSRGRILKRRLPDKFGSLPIIVSPDSALRFWSTDIEKIDANLFKICEELVTPGAVVWDIGANLGLFTFPASYLAGESGKVLAVEPDPFLVELLNKSKKIKSDKRANVEVLPVAISDEVKISKLNIAERGRSSNFLDEVAGSTQTGGTRESLNTVTVSLDWLLKYFAPPTVLKIDVEGAENNALKGATFILSKIKPKIFCEVTSENAAEVTSYLKGNGYEIYDAYVAEDKRHSLEKAVWNTLAIPNK